VGEKLGTGGYRRQGRNQRKSDNFQALVVVRASSLMDEKQREKNRENGERGEPVRLV
jgi:hypothetical protein